MLRHLFPAVLLALGLAACSGAKMDPAPLLAEVDRIQAEAESRAASPAAEASLERSEALESSARATLDKAEPAMASLLAARQAAITSLATGVAVRREGDADVCLRGLADARRSWEDALHQLELTEKVTGRQARGIDRTLNVDPPSIALPQAPPLPPDSSWTPDILSERGRAWAQAASDLGVPASDLEATWAAALLRAQDPKRKPELMALDHELAAWCVVELSARVRGEAALQSCSEARDAALRYSEARDHILWAMVDIERGMKETARRDLADLESRQKSLFDSLKQFEGKFASIRQEARGTIMSLSDILFDFDKATLRRDAELNLAKVAVILAQYPEMQIHIEGHTDNIGSEEYNLKLSERRAESVYAFLEEQDITIARMTTAGFGMSRPVESNETEQGRQKNRRVDLVPGFCRGGNSSKLFSHFPT